MVAFIKTKGRLTREDLVTGFSKIVKIEPTEEDQARLRILREETAKEIERQLANISTEA